MKVLKPFAQLHSVKQVCFRGEFNHCLLNCQEKHKTLQKSYMDVCRGGSGCVKRRQETGAVQGLWC